MSCYAYGRRHLEKQQVSILSDCCLAAGSCCRFFFGSRVSVGAAYKSAAIISAAAARTDTSTLMSSVMYDGAKPWWTAYIIVQSFILHSFHWQPVPGVHSNNRQISPAFSGVPACESSSSKLVTIVRVESSWVKSWIEMSIRANLDRPTVLPGPWPTTELYRVQWEWDHDQPRDVTTVHTPQHTACCDVT